MKSQSVVIAAGSALLGLFFHAACMHPTKKCKIKIKGRGKKKSKSDIDVSHSVIIILILIMT